jgi:hypothetical protein
VRHIASTGEGVSAARLAGPVVGLGLDRVVKSFQSQRPQLSRWGKPKSADDRSIGIWPSSRPQVELTRAGSSSTTRPPGQAANDPPPP